MSNITEIVPGGTEIRAQDSLPAVIADDLKQLHTALTKVRTAWAQPLSVDETCKLALVTTKLLESRRKLMGFPHEMLQNPQSRRVSYFSPYAD